MARRLGTAYVGIEADASLFRATTMAGMKKAIAGLEAEIPVTASTKKATTQIKRFLAELQLEDATIDLHLNEDQARRALADLRGRVLDLNTFLHEMRANPQLSRDALHEVARLQLAVKDAATQLNKMKVSPQALQKAEEMILGLEKRFGRAEDAAEKFAKAEDDAGKRARFLQVMGPRIDVVGQKLRELKDDIRAPEMMAEIARITAALDRMKARKFEVSQAGASSMLAEMASIENRTVKVAAAMRQAAAAQEDFARGSAFWSALEPRVEALADRLASMHADIDDKMFRAKIARMQASVARFRAQKLDLSEAGQAKAIADIAAMELATDALGVSIQNMNDRLTKGRVAWFGWIGGLLNAKVALFAGAREVTGWHIALDSIVETLAILVPAMVVLTAGLGAFAAEAYLAQDTLKRIGDHMKYVQTVSEATGKAIPPLTNHFDQMASKIRPQVFSLLGAALGGAGEQMGLLDKLATGTGAVLDRFAARIIVDMHSGGNGIRKFVETGTYDLKQLGIIAQNIGHVIAQMARVASQTHIAEVLVTGLAGFSRLLGIVSDLPTPMLAFVAALHGVYLWSGIATSAVVKMVLAPARGLAMLLGGAKAVGMAVKSLPDDAKGWARIKAYGTDIGQGLKQIPGRLEAIKSGLIGLATNPWAWAAAGVVALTGLVIYLSRVKTGTEQFIASLDDMTKRATVFNVLNTLGAELIQVNERLAGAQKKFNDEVAKSQDRAPALKARLGGLTESAAGAGQAVQDLTAKQKTAFGQMLIGTTRLSGLSAAYGMKGLAGGMALAALAGVRVSDLLSSDERVWATAKQQVEDLVKGYQAMGQGANQLASDLNALTVAGADSVKQIDNINKAFDYFTTTVAGPVDTFLSLDQSITRFGQDAKVAGARMTGLGGGIEVASKKVKTSSVQLQQDFQDTFKASEQLFDAMRASQAPADLQVKAIKSAVAAMIPMAGTSKVAAAEISALAQEAGGPATTNLQTLKNWVGKMHDPLGQLKADSDAASVGFSNLSLDAQKLGTTLAQDLTDDMAKAVEQAVGLQGALNQYAKDIQHADDQTAKGQADRNALYQILVKITGSGSQANAVIQAMSDKIHGNAQAISETDKWRKAFNADIKKILDQTPGAASDVQKLADAVENHGLKSDEYSKARKKLIDDLEKAGVDAKTATGEVDGLVQSISGLQGKNITIVMVGNASYQIKDLGTGTTQAIGTHTAAGRGASGLYINSGTSSTADDVPIWASRGEYVTRASAVTQYGKSAMDAVNAGKAVIGYAGGGMVGLANGGYINYAQHAKLPALYPFSKDLAGGLQSAMLSKELKLMTAALKSSEIKAAQSFFAAPVGNVGGGVERWRGLVNKALAMEGLSAMLANAVLYQMQTESGGNPNAINLWDSNAKAGDPSRGLMQTIGSTFRAFHWPGTSWNIYDPLANIAAAINYAHVRYGPSLQNVRGGIGSGHGYAEGGLIGYQTGGPVGDIRDALSAAQAGEKDKYFGLTHSIAMDLAHAKPGSYTSRYRKTLRSELVTLASRQKAELAAYKAISGRGLTTANLRTLSSAAKAASRTATDQALTHQHPLFARDYRGYLTSLSDIGLRGMPAGYDWTGAVSQLIPFAGGLQNASRGPAVTYSYDSGGWIPPGTTVVRNGTGTAERLSGPGAVSAGEAALIARLDRLICLMASAPAAYNQALSGVAGRSAGLGYYR